VYTGCYVKPTHEICTLYVDVDAGTCKVRAGDIDFIVQEQGRDQFGQNFLIPLSLHVCMALVLALKV
jgi:hypothetical protein